MRDLIQHLLNEKHQRTIACDLDGTLAEYNGWKGDEHFGAPIQTVIDALRKEHNKGSKIIINTARINSDLDKELSTEQIVELIKAWLDENNVPYDEIWQGSGKPIADEYWDDRAVLIKNGEIIK